jgi:hypothetical protein
MTFNARQSAQHQADLFAEYPLTDYSTEERADIAATQAYDLCREPNHTDIIAWLEIMAKALPELTVLVEACHDEVERLYRSATEGCDEAREPQFARSGVFKSQMQATVTPLWLLHGSSEAKGDLCQI